MRVSIIVPSYNSFETLGRLIESFPHEDDDILEILIVDSSDRSTYESLKLLASGRDKVRYIHKEQKTIPAIARNIGADAAKGDLLVFIDSDAYPGPGWLEAIKEANEQGYRAGGGSVDLPPFQQGRSIETAQYYLQFNEFLPVLQREERTFIPSCNFFCEKELFDKVGGFPNIRACEDVMFGDEISRHTPIAYLPECRVFHIFGSSWSRLRSNQRLLGEYVSIYRAHVHGGVFYSKPIQYLLSPLFVFVKVTLLTSRIIRTDRTHRKAYMKAFPTVLIGLLSWCRGYIKGIGNRNGEFFAKGSAVA